MIYFGATGILRTWPQFNIANDPHTDVRSDEQLIFRSDDPAVLEERVNAAGVEQWTLGRALDGIQLGGSGQGGQFSVMMLLSRDAGGGGAAELMKFSEDDDNDTGIRAFFFKAETEAELRVQLDAALARIATWINKVEPVHTDLTWRGYEISGSSFGAAHMGMLIVYRGS
jgi:hypothetical protein